MKTHIIFRELIKPSSPTPSHHKNYTLSLFDQINAHFYVPLVLFYSAEQTSQFEQIKLSQVLRRSLSEALTQFYPLAGRMKGESSVDCNDEGVHYIEAELNVCLSDVIDQPLVDVLNKFIPCYSSEKGLKREELLAIQVNFFACGGLTIGVCISHRIADACTLSNFIKYWAGIARGDACLVGPIFISASLFPPREPLGYKPISPIPQEGLITKRLVFSASIISALKEETTHGLTEEIQPTRVEVITTFIWKYAINQARLKGCAKSVVFHPVNIRRRMVPPLPDHSFGNLFLMANAVSEGETGSALLVAKLRAAIKKIDSKYIKEREEENGFKVFMNNFWKISALVSEGEVQIFRFSSWCRFPIYETDFGWGKPSWVSSATASTRNSVFLMDSKCPGGVEAWVTMHEEDVAVLDQLQAFIEARSC